MESIFDLYIHEDAYGDLDAEGAVARLAQALRFETRSADPAPGAFEGLHAHIRDSFPHVMAAGSFDLFRSFYHFYRCWDPDLFHSSRLGKSLPQFFDAVFKNQFLQI